MPFGIYEKNREIVLGILRSYKFVTLLGIHFLHGCVFFIDDFLVFANGKIFPTLLERLN